MEMNMSWCSSMRKWTTKKSVETTFISSQLATELINGYNGADSYNPAGGSNGFTNWRSTNFPTDLGQTLVTNVISDYNLIINTILITISKQVTKFRILVKYLGNIMEAFLNLILLRAI